MTFRVAAGCTDREISLTKINVTIKNRIYILSALSLSCSFAGKTVFIRSKQEEMSFQQVGCYQCISNFHSDFLCKSTCCSL